MKLPNRQKLLLIFEEIFKFSFGQLLMLQIIVMILMVMLCYGAEQIIGSLPNWALAVGASGAITICIASFVLRKPQMIYVVLGFVGLLALQIGGADVIIPDTSNSQRSLNFWSFNDLVSTFSWMIVIGLTLGGVLAGFLATDHTVSKIKIDNAGAKSSANKRRSQWAKEQRAKWPW